MTEELFEMAVWLLFFILPLINCGYLVYDDCPFNGSTISVGTPITLSSNSSNSVYGQQKLQAYLLFQQWLHYERIPPGIMMNGESHCLQLVFKEDYQDVTRVAQITQDMVDNQLVDIFLSSYTSTLTKPMLDITDAHEMVAVTEAGVTSILSERRYSVSMLSEAEEMFNSILRVLHYRGAQTLSVFYENNVGLKSACEPIAQIIEDMNLGITLLQSEMVSYNPTEDEMYNLFTNYSSTDSSPDILIGCTFFQACVNGINALVRSELRPKSMIFTTCSTLPQFVEEVGDNATYLISGVQWERSLEYVDEMTLWTSENFHQNFSESAGFVPTYHAAAAFASLEVIVQVIETANSLDSNALSYELATLSMTSFYGIVEFNSNNMNNADRVNIQLVDDLAVIIVAPDDLATGSLVYPMISWEQRICWSIFGSDACRCDPTCRVCSSDDLNIVIGDCNDITGMSEVNYEWKPDIECRKDLWEHSLHQQAMCGYIPLPSLISKALISLSTICILFSLICSIWIYCHRNEKFIKANQPLFLIIFSVGTIVTCIDIPLFMGRPSVSLCSARIGLLMTALTMMFGSLLLIVFRVWRVFGNRSLQVSRFKETQMLSWLTVLLIVDGVILSIWLTSFPPQVRSDFLVDAHTTEVSNLETFCSYDFRMTVMCVVYKAIQMVAGCVLAWATRNVDKRVLQSNYLMVGSVNITIIWMFFILLSSIGLDSHASTVGNAFVLLISSIAGTVFVLLPKLNMYYRMKSTGNYHDNSQESGLTKEEVVASRNPVARRNVMKIPPQMPLPIHSQIHNPIVGDSDEYIRNEIAKLSAKETAKETAIEHHSIATGGVVHIRNDNFDMTFSPHEVLELVDMAGELEDEVAKLRQEVKSLKALKGITRQSSFMMNILTRNQIAPIQEEATKEAALSLLSHDK